MKLVEVDFNNEDIYYSGDKESLSKWDIEKLEAREIQEAYYYYFNGGYDGSGNILFKDKNGLWEVESLGHCSCYDPVEYVNDGKYDNLDELYEKCSGDYKKEIQPLFDAAKANGN